jgi:hypothetical protein
VFFLRAIIFSRIKNQNLRTTPDLLKHVYITQKQKITCK